MPASKKLLESLISEVVSKLLMENPQQAEKVYFSSGKLSPRVKEILISKITHGDPYTKVTTDYYYTKLHQDHKHSKWALAQISNEPEDDSPPESDVMDLEGWKNVKEFHRWVSTYDKNVYPLKHFTINPKNAEQVWEMYSALKQRNYILGMFAKFPSVAKRNMKEDVRQPRTYVELQQYRSRMEYFDNFFAMVANRPPALRQNIYNKVFKAGSTIESLIDFMEEKDNLVGGGRLNQQDVLKMIDGSPDLRMIYRKGNYMVVEVSDGEGIKEIGCNSLWCFTYGEGMRAAIHNWDRYSTNGIVYVVIDFSVASDDIDFMHVLIRPLPDEDGKKGLGQDTPLFNMSNEAMEYPNNFFERTIGLNTAKNIFTFNYDSYNDEHDPEDELLHSIGNKSAYPYQDPQQTKLDLQELRKQTRHAILENHSQAIVNFTTGDITASGEKVGEMDLMHKGGKNPYNGFGYLYLSRIFIEKPFRGKGYAQKAMEQLIDYADQQKLIITLTPANDWGAGVSRLTKWYRSFGFVPNKGRNKDWNHRDGMHRLPL